MLVNNLIKNLFASRLKPAKEERTLIIINADTSKRAEIPLDRSKERLADYAILKARLQGDILDWNDIESHKWAKLLARFSSKGVALAALAFARRQRYQLFYSDSENNGMTLALLFKLSRTKKPFLMIGHWILSPKKTFFFKWLRLHTHITTIFLHSSTQYSHAIDKLGIPARRLQMLPYQVDTEFWKVEHAQPVAAEAPYICAVGLEFRDYPTLVEAVRGMPLNLKIAAASHWSHRSDSTQMVSLPENVQVKSYNYTELRDLYAGSRFVVVPLYDTETYQAGITVILEAMAMGKAVIVTRTGGQGDTIVDRRKTIRTGAKQGLDTTGKFSHLFGESEAFGPTGLYVNPADVAEMRQAITYLLNHPEVAEELGRNGRATVEKLMSVEQFANRIHHAIYENTGLISYDPRPGSNIQPYQPGTNLNVKGN